MTAQVIDLAARRASAATCDCPRHRVEALAARARELFADLDGQLLVAAAPQAQFVRDVIDLAELLTAPPAQQGNP